MSKPIPIFLSSDDNYAPFVATTIASICANTTSFIDFYVLDGGISDFNKNQIENLKEKFENLSIEFMKIDTTKEFKNIQPKKHITLSAFNRLLIPQLKPGIDKALYLDVDIIVLGDIAELYNEPLENYVIGAVVDQVVESHIDLAKSALNMRPDSHYFNSGVLLIDCEAWRSKNITPQLMKLEAQYGDVRIHNDQDILNKYFENNNYKMLDKKYNVMHTNDSVVLRHFIGPVKPVHSDIKDVSNKNLTAFPHKDEFWKYATMTAFYNTFLELRAKFLDANPLYKRLNKIFEKQTQDR